MLNLKFIYTLVFLLTITNYLPAQPIWLSNRIPADAGRTIKPAGMHHLASESKGRGNVKVVQWLMLGEEVEDAEYYVPTDAIIESLVFAPSGKKVEHSLDSIDQRLALAFPNKEEGFYNAYIIVKNVSGDTLHYAIAKGEL